VREKEKEVELRKADITSNFIVALIIITLMTNQFIIQYNLNSTFESFLALIIYTTIYND